MIFSFRTLFSHFLRQFTQFLNFFFKNFTMYFLQKMIQLFLKAICGLSCFNFAILEWLAQPFYHAALRAKPNQKMEVASSVQEKDKMADGSGFPSPLPCVVANLLIFEGKRWVISDKNRSREQKQYSCLKLLVPSYRLKNRKT